MKTLQDDKCPDKTRKPGKVRMGREVSTKKASGCDSEKNAECADTKVKTREDVAGSLV
jgi:hypothetical protein